MCAGLPSRSTRRGAGPHDGDAPAHAHSLSARRRSVVRRRRLHLVVLHHMRPLLPTHPTGPASFLQVRVRRLHHALPRHRHPCRAHDPPDPLARRRQGDQRCWCALAACALSRCPHAHARASHILHAPTPCFLPLQQQRRLTARVVRSPDAIMRLARAFQRRPRAPRS